MIRLRTLALCVALLSTSCAVHTPPRIAGDIVDIGAGGCATPGADTAAFSYLRAGGMLIRWREQEIATAPFYSNPGMLQLGLGLPISPNKARIRRHLKANLLNVPAILVGHAHYDHAMDLPFIANEYALAAQIYGSTTLANLLSDDPDKRREQPDPGRIHPSRMRSVNSGAGNWRRAGSWIQTSRDIRFMALHSAHAPHFAGLEFFQGVVGKWQDELPFNAYGWKKGQTFSYLIDLLDEEGEVALRVHYQDAAAPPPYGLPAPELLNAHGVDVAILCPASFSRVKDYAAGAVRDLAPRHVILGHWEDFFQSPDRPARVVRGTNLSEFLDRMKTALPEGATYTLPNPDRTTVRVQACGD